MGRVFGIEKEKVLTLPRSSKKDGEDEALDPTWLPYTERPFDYMLQKYWAKDGNCRELATYLREKIRDDENGTSIPGSSRFVNTGLFMAHDKFQTIDPRKEHLFVLSFLATQHPSLILNLVVSGGKEAAKSLPEWLRILLKHEVYGKRIHVHYFDPIRDVEKLGLSKNETESIQRAFGEGNIKHVASISDIQRYIALYLNGGIWFDTDTIFLTDVRPLMGVDSVTLTQSQFFNNAVVSTSKPRSEFMKITLQTCASLYETKPNHTGYFRYGPQLFKALRNDISRPMPFKALPGCLVDTSWTGGFTGALGWDQIFAEKATEANLAFLSDESGAFSFHWHGRWDKAVVKGSSASIAHANYVRELGLDASKFHAQEDELDLKEWRILQK